MAGKAVRETLESRLGFLLLAVGCAVGLGNVWRFPYMAGRYGGASFVMIYLIFLILLGLPIMVMELSVGRAARRNIGLAFKTLEPAGTHWHIFGHAGIAGNYLLMMYYTTIVGWILFYFFSIVSGDLSGLSLRETEGFFDAMLVSPLRMGVWMVLAIFLGFLVTRTGLRKGVERVSKFMVLTLFFLVLVLAVKAMTLEGASAGLRFYLLPDFRRMLAHGPGEVIFAAMGQAFFTLSLGMGGMAIFGSYIGKDRALSGESVRIAGLDTSVAVMCGLIIFPACFAFDMSPEAGPGLLFIILPNIFNQMAGGRFWGSIFFLFMSFAGLSTVVAVFENIVSYWIDVWGWERSKASWGNCVALSILSIPTVLGFNVLSDFQPLGPGTTVLELEDMIVSSTLLPIGALIFIFFTTSRYGWGWNNFIAEANAGTGLLLPLWVRIYVSWILPLIIMGVFIKGYWDIFGSN